MRQIKTLIEARRGCGHRKKGAFYLIGTGQAVGCCKLVFPLKPCYCCGNSIKFSRGFQWISTYLFHEKDCTNPPNASICPLDYAGEKMGLMWVGVQHYPTTVGFMREAAAIGVSKRLGVIPREVKPGTWVALAHPRAVSVPDINTMLTTSKVSVKFSPGVFYVFKVTTVQYVVRGDESETELDEIEARGIELVDVKPEGDQIELPIKNITNGR